MLDDADLCVCCGDSCPTCDAHVLPSDAVIGADVLVDADAAIGNAFDIGFYACIAFLNASRLESVPVTLR